MAEATTTGTRTETPDRPGGALGVETRSIDWVPDAERHGKVWHQGPLWFLGNFQYFTIALGFVGPSLGLPLGHTILAGVLGIVVGTLFMAFHASQGPVLGLPQMIQSRAQFGYRGVILVLIGTLFTYLGFNVADQVLLSEGLNGVFGWSPAWVAMRHRAAGDPARRLRARLAAPGLPLAAVRLAAPDAAADRGRADRAGRLGTPPASTWLSPGRPSSPSSPPPPRTTSRTRPMSRTTRATCPVRPPPARSSPPCSSAPPAPRSG